MATTPKDVRAGELDATDRELLRLLQSDARMPNSELAQRVGIAASTCHGRLRRLVDLGIILAIRVLKNIVGEQKLPERGGCIIGLLLVELLCIDELLCNDISLLDEILSAQGSLKVLLQVERLTV